MCVYTRQVSWKAALQQNWQSSEKSQYFKEKTQYLMNTLYNNSIIFQWHETMDIAKFLIEQGANVNIRTYNLNTPLHMAVEVNYICIG